MSDAIPAARVTSDPIAVLSSRARAALSQIRHPSYDASKSLVLAEMKARDIGIGA